MKTKSAILLMHFAFVFFPLLSRGDGAHQYEQIYEPPNRDIADKLLGFKPKPSIRMHSIKRVDGRTLYDVHYTIDAFSRRDTPVENAGARKNFALFFGCSYTFGEGLNDDQTMEYLVSKELKDVRAYNYGFSAYGAQQMLARLEDGKIPEQVKERRGVGLYFFVGDHMRRTLGTLDLVHNWSTMPYYDFSDGKLVRKADSFEEGKPVSEYLTRFAWFKKLVQWRHFKFTDRDYDLFSEIILESKHRFETQFPGSVFYVVFMGGWGEEHRERLIPFLSKKGIRFLDYSKTPELDGGDFYFKFDGHPNPRGAETFASTLSPDLKRILSELK